MVPKSDQLLMNSKKLQDIGSTIISDTTPLAANLQSFWPQPEAALNSKGGKDTLINCLPACLQHDFENYAQQQKAELNKILQNRQQIGQLLSEASSLVDFQARLSQEQFASINIYSVNNYYDSSSETVPCHLLMPDCVKRQRDSN